MAYNQKVVNQCLFGGPCVESIALNLSRLEGCSWDAVDQLKFKGIYFLFSSCGELLYVGAGADISRRLMNRHPVVKIYGEANVYVRVFRDLEDDRDLESLLIARLSPSCALIAIVGFDPAQPNTEPQTDSPGLRSIHLANVG